MDRHHQRQRGVVSPSLIAGGIIALVFVGMAAAIKVQSARLDACKEEHAAFVAKVMAEGEASKAQAARLQAARDEVTKTQEAENAKRYSVLNDRYAAAQRRLRERSDSDSGQTKSLSEAAVTAHCADGQADLAGRLLEFEGSLVELLRRGDTAIERTVQCRDWLTAQQTAGSVR